MRYRAIRVETAAADHPRRCHLGSDLVAALAAARAEDAPAVLIVSKLDVDAFAACELVVDRGVKHPRAKPSDGMLGQSRIPLKRAGYRSRRTVVNGARAVLERGVKVGERLIYIFAVGNDLVDDLWANGASAPPAATESQPAPPSVISVTKPPAVAPTTQDLPLVYGPTAAERRPRPAPGPRAGAAPRSNDGLEDRFVGNSAPIRQVRREIVRLAASTEPVRIEGKRGTGKALVARLVHDSGPRRGKPFVEIPCRQASGDALELDPHHSSIRGGQRDGTWASLLHLAQGGTIFLRDIEFLPPLLQSRLIELFASQRDGLGPDVRIVAATTIEPESSPARNRVSRLAGHFTGGTVFTPSLEDVSTDVPIIAKFLWARAVYPLGLALQDDVLDFLKDRDWPGNADELEHVLWILFARHERCDLAGVRAAAGELSARSYLGCKPTSVRGEIPLTKQDWTSRYRDHVVDVTEAFRAFWVGISPIRHPELSPPLTLARIRTMQEDTGTALKTLAELCLTLLYFPTVEIQDAVLRLKGEMMSIRARLVEDPEALAKSWTKESEALYEQTIRDLFAARDSLLPGID